MVQAKKELERLEAQHEAEEAASEEDRAAIRGFEAEIENQQEETERWNYEMERLRTIKRGEVDPGEYIRLLKAEFYPQLHAETSHLMIDADFVPSYDWALQEVYNNQDSVRSSMEQIWKSRGEHAVKLKELRNALRAAEKEAQLSKAQYEAEERGDELPTELCDNLNEIRAKYTDIRIEQPEPKILNEQDCTITNKIHTKHVTHDMVRMLGEVNGRGDFSVLNTLQWCPDGKLTR